MSKIRINELARELEVKPNVILDLLPELGVTDKKTHSSSLDDELALQIRHHVTGGDGDAAPAPVTEAAELEAPPTSQIYAPELARRPTLAKTDQVSAPPEPSKESAEERAQ